MHNKHAVLQQLLRKHNAHCTARTAAICAHPLYTCVRGTAAPHLNTVDKSKVHAQAASHQDQTNSLVSRPRVILFRTRLHSVQSGEIASREIAHAHRTSSCIYLLCIFAVV